MDENRDKFFVNVEGFVNIGARPRFNQVGENVVLTSNKKYLCVNVMRVENIRPAETRGIVDAFISVEWCGTVQRTRTVKENNNPTYNELLYFQVPIKEEYIRDPEKHVQKLNEEFLSKNEVSFNLMIEGDDNTYDNLGRATFHLSGITSGDKQQRKYFADDLKREKKYVTRIFTDKSKLTSAFSLSNNTYVHYEAWFLDDFPAIVDFGEKKKESERTDKIPIELSKNLNRYKDAYTERARREIPIIFSKYNHYASRERLFNMTKAMDQYKNTHLLPYYLSLISMPEIKYSEDDYKKNPNFFDSNLSTLDEIAHYVRCIPYSSDPHEEVWSSPDFILTTRKGNQTDHAILMACLMMGLKKVSRIKYYEKVQQFLYNDTPDDSITADGTDSTTGGGTVTGSTANDITATSTINPTTSGKNSKRNSKLQVSDNLRTSFPYENRTFVCLGKLKVSRDPYIWVMTISSDYRDVVMWDPKLFKKYELQGRVDDGDKLKNFLLGKYPDYESVKKGKLQEPIEEESDDEDDDIFKVKPPDLEEIVLKGVNEDSVLEYKDVDDEFMDYQIEERDQLLVDYDVVAKKDEDNDAFTKQKSKL